MTMIDEDFFRTETVLSTEAVMDGARHLTKAVVVGVAPDGRLHIAGTHGGADSADLCALAVRALLSGDVEALAA
jgi:hypothetical protein